MYNIPSYKDEIVMSVISSNKNKQFHSTSWQKCAFTQFKLWNKSNESKM